jgi:hypothetical protein
LPKVPDYEARRKRVAENEPAPPNLEMKIVYFEESETPEVELEVAKPVIAAPLPVPIPRPQSRRRSSATAVQPTLSNSRESMRSKENIQAPTIIVQQPIKPFTIISRSGSVELRLNQSQIEKLENCSFNIAANPVTDREIVFRLNDPTARMKERIVVKKELTVRKERTPNIEQLPSFINGTRAARRAGFMLDNTILMKGTTCLLSHLDLMSTM